jgi:Amt family ammonium transporter
LFVTAGPAGAQEISADAVKVELDNAYVLLSAVLVIFMQAGFALVEAGLTRAKSVANIMMENLMDFMVGVLAFFCVGYAIAFGLGNDFLGRTGFFLGDGVPSYWNLDLFVFFIFQLAFAATAATIVSGAMAERTKFKAYFFYSIVDHGIHLPSSGALVLGWGLARADGHAVHRLRGVDDRARDRGCCRLHGRPHARASHRQVRT